MRFTWKTIFPRATKETHPSTRRRPNRMSFSWDDLEARTVLSHGGGFQHLHDVVHVSSSSTSTAVSAAEKTLQTDVQAILGASGTTVAQLSAIATSFETLKADGLTPTSQSALTTFENSLVTSLASGTTLTGNATLLAQFEALYTATPTTQQTTDLTTAYNALAAAVTSSNITSANITTITADYAAVLKAEGSTSTATYPFFSLVTGGHQGFGQANGFGSCVSSSSTSTAVSAAEKTLQTDVQAILGASGTTVAQLSAIATSFETLKADGLTPTSQSALTTFENSLVTSLASGTTLTGNATLLAQFEALYTATPTTQQTTDLTAAYNALAAAVTSSNITSANITTITADYAAVLKAEGSTSTATYPFFSLVTGGHQGFGRGHRG